MQHHEGRLSCTFFSLDFSFMLKHLSMFSTNSPWTQTLHHQMALVQPPGDAWPSPPLEEHRSISPSSGQPVAPARRSPNPGPEAP